MKTDAKGTFAGSTNVPADTRLHVYARYPMDAPTARGYVEDFVAGDLLLIHLEELGPLQAKDVK